MVHLNKILSAQLSLLMNHATSWLLCNIGLRWVDAKVISAKMQYVLPRSAQEIVRFEIDSSPAF